MQMRSEPWSLCGLWVFLVVWFYQQHRKITCLKRLVEIWEDEVRKKLLEINSAWCERLGNWAPNKFFNGDELTSFIMFRRKRGILWFGDQKSRKEFSNPFPNIILCFIFWVKTIQLTRGELSWKRTNGCRVWNPVIMNIWRPSYNSLWCLGFSCKDDMTERTFPMCRRVNWANFSLCELVAFL